MSSQWVTLEIGDSTMPVYVSSPEGAGPYPTVIVGMHAFGVTEFIRGKCDDLASAGYVTAAPYLYHRQGGTTMEELHAITPEDPSRRERGIPMKEKLRDAEIITDMSATLEYVRGLPTVEGRAGVTGFCIGGRIAMLMSMRTDNFAACADFYGTDMADAWGDGSAPLTTIADVSCPVAGFFGNLDQNPTHADVDALEAELKRHGKQYSFNRYDGANHAFNDPTSATRWTPHAASDAWSKLLKFFDEVLKAAPRA